MILRLPKTVRVVLVVCLMQRALWAESSLQWKFQRYSEDDGRVLVNAFYSRAETDLSEYLGLAVVGLVDTISGATPTGSIDLENGVLEYEALPGEHRLSAILDLDWKIGESSGLFEGSYSDEPDYISRGIATNLAREFNEGMTTVRWGVSSLIDTVNPIGQTLVDNDRRSLDLLLGLEQIIDSRTTLSLNLGYSRAWGYLSDPYKAIGKTEVIAIPGGSPIVVSNAWRENRPDERTRWTLFSEIHRYFGPVRGAVALQYRFSTDDWEIDTQMARVEWTQKVGQYWALIPSFRYFQQSAAEFYYTTLDGTAIEPVEVPLPGGPFYSADYRLSKLYTTTLGLKVVYMASDRLNFDVAYERYRMLGRDSVTLPEAYPSANIITIGAHYAF